MKKTISILLSCILIMGLCACGGNTAGVKIEPYQSGIYEDAQIQSAIDVIIKYFARHFSGCTLTKITYAGDKKTRDHIEWAQRHNADEVIVLISSFDVAASGASPSLNPNSTYNNWLWILVRNNGGKWRHVDHGY